MPHVIRLRYPWRLTRATDELLEFSRNFNLPGGLEPDQEIWLVVKAAEKAVLLNWSLNGLDSPVAHSPSSSLRVAVRQRLEISNRLSLGFQRNKNSGSMAGDSLALNPNHTLDIGGAGCIDSNRIDLSPWAAVTLEIATPSWPGKDFGLSS